MDDDLNLPEGFQPIPDFKPPPGFQLVNDADNSVTRHGAGRNQILSNLPPPLGGGKPMPQEGPIGGGTRSIQQWPDQFEDYLRLNEEDEKAGDVAGRLQRDVAEQFPTKEREAVDVPKMQDKSGVWDTRGPDVTKAQPVGWRGMVDQLNPIGTAEARSPYVPKDPDKWPASPEEFQQKYHRAPTEQEQKYYDMEPEAREAEKARETAAKRTRKSTYGRMQSAYPQEVKEPKGIHWGEAYEKGGWRGLLDELSTPEKGIAPFSTPFTFGQKVKEGASNIWEGGKKVIGERTEAGETQRAAGARQMGSGVLELGFSPWESAYESAVSQPLENLTGAKKEHTNALMMVLGPGGVGALTKAGDAAIPGLKTAQKLAAPETLSSDAREAANLWKEYTGIAARVSEQSHADIMRGFKDVSELDGPSKVNIQKYLDGDPAATAPPAQMGKFVDDLRDAFKDRKDAMNNLDKYAQYQFRNEYFPRMWEDPNQAQQFIRSWSGSGRMGSTGFTQQRTIPTITDGLNAGLKLKSENPIQPAIEYIQNADRVIATEMVLQQAKKMGLVKDEKELEALQQKAPAYASTFRELQGRGPVSGLYAPDGFATVWDNAVQGGFQDVTKTLMDTWRKGSNFATQALLAGSQYHAFTMAEAAASTQLARAIGPDGGTTGSRILKGLGYPAAPITYAFRGKSLKETYLGASSKAWPFWTSSKMPGVTKQDDEIVDLLTRGGGRMAGAGIRHTGDIETSAFGDFYSSFTRHAGAEGLKTPWEGAKQIGREYKNLYEQSSLPGFAAKVIPVTLGRAMQTFSKPLFQHYIPLIKNGASGQMMGDYLKANPLASMEEKLDAARRIVNMTDARFGEMIQDNIFWKKTHKQAAMAAMLSYSWNVGGAKVIGGGARDIGRFASGTGAWTPEAAYFTAFSMNWAMMNAAYQYMKTGQKPGDSDTPIQDIFAARTGGTKLYKTDAATKKRTKQDYIEGPERILLPGLAKEIFGFSDRTPFEEFANKMNPLAKALMDTANNERWYQTDYGAVKGPMFEPTDPEMKSLWQKIPTYLGNIIDRMAQGGTPIALSQQRGKDDPYSRMNKFETFMGMRQAPPMISDPFHEAKKRGAEARKYETMLNTQAKRKRLMEQRKQDYEKEYGGPQ